MRAALPPGPAASSAAALGPRDCAVSTTTAAAAHTASSASSAGRPPARGMATLRLRSDPEIRSWDLEIGALANAAGAHVATQLTCADAMPSVEELQRVMEDAA